MVWITFLNNSSSHPLSITLQQALWFTDKLLVNLHHSVVRETLLLLFSNWGNRLRKVKSLIFKFTEVVCEWPGIKPSGLQYTASQEMNELLTLHSPLNSIPQTCQCSPLVPRWTEEPLELPRPTLFIYMSDYSIDMIQQAKLITVSLPSAWPPLLGAQDTLWRRDSYNSQMNPKCFWLRLNPIVQDGLTNNTHKNKMP